MRRIKTGYDKVNNDSSVLQSELGLTDATESKHFRLSMDNETGSQGKWPVFNIDMSQYQLLMLIALFLVLLAFLAFICYANLPTTWTLRKQTIDLDFISNAELERLKEPEIKIVPADTLWDNHRALIMIVRRPGCVMCRKEAKILSFLKPELDAARIKLFAIVHEKLDVDQFRSYFAGDVYLDKERRFFGPTERKLPYWHGLLRFDTYYHLLRAKRAGIEGNRIGEGRVLGGVLLIGKGEEGVLFQHYEKSFGDIVNIYRLLDVVRDLAKCETQTTEC